MAGKNGRFQGHQKLVEFGVHHIAGLIQHMRDGYTFESYTCVIECSLVRLNKWCELYPAFREAKELGNQLRSFKLQEIAMNELVDPSSGKVDAGLLKFYLKNVDEHNFKDKQVSEETHEHRLLIDTGIKRPADEGYVEWIDGECTDIEQPDTISQTDTPVVEHDLDKCDAGSTMVDSDIDYEQAKSPQAVGMSEGGSMASLL